MSTSYLTADTLFTSINPHNEALPSIGTIPELFSLVTPGLKNSRFDRDSAAIAPGSFVVVRFKKA